MEAALARLAVRWVGAIERRPRKILALVLGLTAAVGLYAGLTLGVNADPRTLIAQDLPFQRRQRELVGTFRTLGDAFLVVIDADSPVAAGRAADALAARLSERKDLFTQVDVPGGGPFFARNALLYLDPDQLDDLVTRLSQVQPFLAGLSADQSVATVADLLREALVAQRRSQAGPDLTVALDRIAASVEATTAHRPAPDPWGGALLGGALSAEARRRVVALRGNLDFGSLLNAAPHVAAIREASAALGLVPGRGFRVRITGEPVLNYEELLAIGEQAQIVGVVSFALFSLAVIAAFRSARLSLALVGGLLVGLVWSNAFAAAAIGHLNQISATVNVLLIGLGGELQIHACMRYRELLRSGRSRSQALAEMAESMSPALFSSACTTAIGFYIFLLTDFDGVAQLGLIAGTGMFLNFASAFTVVPAILALGAEPAPVSEVVVPRLGSLAHLPVRFAPAVRLAALALAVASLLALPRMRFDYNLLDLRDPHTESVQAFEDLLAGGDRTPWTIDVVTPSLEAARALAGRVGQLEVVRETRTLEDYVPDHQEEKLEILESASFLVPEPAAAPPLPPGERQQRAALQKLAAEAARTARESKDPALARVAARLHTAVERFLAGLQAEASPLAALAGLQANVVGSLPEQLRDLGPLLAPQRVGIADLPVPLVEQMVAADGRARVQIYPRQDISDSIALERFVDEVRAVAPEATGGAVWQVEWGRTTWRAMVRALAIGFVCMIVFLVLLWRSVWDTLLAFFPLALAMLLTCAGLIALGQPFNFVNVVVLPMLVGMGVDNGIHLVHRHRQRPDEIDVLASSTARAVLFSALTTVLTFGSLGLASHRGLASLGQLLTLGVFLTLVCYVVVLPAVLEWDDRRRAKG